MLPVLVTGVKPGFTQMKEGSAFWIVFLNISVL